jgi:hypothetical protein
MAREWAGTGVEQETFGQEEVRDKGNTSAAAEDFFSKSQIYQAAQRALWCSKLRGPSRRDFRFQGLMHFSAYLVIAALVLMGLQLAYAFYQLASFVL